MFRARRARQARRPFSPAWVILFAALVTAGLVFGLRARTAARLSPLESLIAANEPFDHVHAILVGPGGTTYVGTHLGLVEGPPHGKWGRVSGIDLDLLALQPTGQGGLYLAGDKGIFRYEGGRLDSLLTGEAVALAVDPQHGDHLLVIQADLGLTESHDGGRTWAKLSHLEGVTPYALAIDPRQPEVVVVGGEGGLNAISRDGGHTWSFSRPAPGVISALLFDPHQPGRLWAAAGGAICYSDDLGENWRTERLTKAKGLAFVSLAIPADGGEMVVVTAEGSLFTLSDVR